MSRIVRALSSRRAEQAITVALFLIGAGIRLWFVLDVHRPAEHVASDMWVYDFRARRLLHGQYDLWDTFTPVGYPAFLALVYATFVKGQAAVGVVQSVLGGATAALAHRIALRVGSGGGAAALAGLIVAGDVALVFYSGLLLSEAPFAFVLALSVWLLLRAIERPGWGSGIIAGIAAGIGTVIRPNLLMAWPLVLLPLWLALRPDRRALFVLLGRLALGALPPVSAAIVHNSRIAGQPAALGTNGGLNFFLNFAEVSSVHYKEGAHTHYIAPIPNLIRYKREYWSPRPFYDERYFYREGFALIRRRPARLWRALDNVVEGAGAGQQDYWPGWPEQDRLLKGWSRWFFRLAIVPATLGFAFLLLSLRFLRKEHAPRLLLGVCVLSSFLVLWLFLGDPRVRVPFDPLIVVLGADAVAIAVLWTKRRAVARWRARYPQKS